MKKIKILFFSVIILLLFAASDSFACSCVVLPVPVEQQVKNLKSRSKAIFSGKVIDITKEPNGFFVKVKFKVNKVWKKVLPETVIIFTGSGGGDCGYPFQTGENYLVYAYGANDNEELNTNICTRTATLINAEKDLKILGKALKPKKKNIKY